MRDRTGEVFRIWRTERRKEGYQDQLGRWHPAHVILEEADVQVVETSDPKGMYGGWKSKNRGLKAVDAQGRKFYQNWETYDDVSYFTSVSWRDSEGSFWRDAKDELKVQIGAPFIYENGEPGDPEPDAETIIVSVSGFTDVHVNCPDGGRHTVEFDRVDEDNFVLLVCVKCEYRFRLRDLLHFINAAMQLTASEAQSIVEAAEELAEATRVTASNLGLDTSGIISVVSEDDPLRQYARTRRGDTEESE